MEEIQGIGYLLSGIVTLGLVMEAARAVIWCTVIAVIFRKPLRRIGKK